MTDLELLEMAAKAAGIGPVIGFAIEAGELMIGPRNNLRYWSPLTDDGKRYRLLKTLEMAIDFEAKEVIYCIKDVQYSEQFREDGDDARAVLRAAAEIGRAMG